MDLEVLFGGLFDSNSYLLIENNEAVLIDAGVSAKRVLDLLKSRSVKLKHILLTHGHIDHILYADEIRKITGASVLIEEADSSAMVDSQKNLSAVLTTQETFDKADRELRDGDEITLGKEVIRVIHTPGHSSGGCCYLTGNMLFSGDTLFAGSLGRTDFFDGNYSTLISSIKEKLMVLPESTVVYPGHGYETTIGDEKRGNPFLVL